MDTSTTWSRAEDFSNYTVLRFIASGNFGEVSHVRSDVDNKEYALKKVDLKRIKDMGAEDPDLVKRVVKMAETEAQTMVHLEQKNIVRIYGYYKDIPNDIYYMAMEYCSKGSLRSFLSKRKQESKPLPELTIQAWTKQLVGALNYIHQREFVHRDFKSANIMVCENGEVKLGDFGIAKHRDEVTKLQDKRTGFFTFGYQSPEFEEGAYYSPECDVWSMGVVVYEMATFDTTGVKAFHTKTPPKYQEVSRQMNYSTHMSDFIGLLLVIDPKKRQTMARITDHDFLKLPYVVIIGAVGSGKTSLAEKILADGRQLATSDFDASVTRESTIYSKPLFDFADTPGYKSVDHKVLHAIHIAKALCYRPVTRIFILCKFNNRLDNMVNDVQCIAAPLSADLHSNITIVVTHWDHTYGLTTPVRDIKARIEAKMKDEFGVESFLFFGIDTKDVEQQIIDVISSTNATAKQINITVDNLSKYFDLRKSETRLLGFTKRLLSDCHIFKAAILEHADRIENIYEKQDFIFSLKAGLRDFIKPVMNDLTGAFDEQNDGTMDSIESKIWLKQLQEELLQIYTSYLNHCKQYRFFLMGSLDKDKNPLRKCPHCGIVWTRVTGCPRETTCGAIPEDLGVERSRKVGQWVWERDAASGQFGFGLKETKSAPFPDTPEKRKTVAAWVAEVINKLSATDIETVLHFLLKDYDQEIMNEYGEMAITSFSEIYLRFIKERASLAAAFGFNDFVEILRLCHSFHSKKISLSEEQHKKVQEILAYYFVKGAEILEDKPKKALADLRREVFDQQLMTATLLSRFTLLYLGEQYRSYEQAYRKLESLYYDGNKRFGCGASIVWDDMPVVPIPADLENTNLEDNATEMFPELLSTEREVTLQLADRWNDTQLTFVR